MNRRKYGNTKVVLDGITFDSKKEARRYKELCLKVDAGEIKGLERQKKYILIPAQYGKTVNGKEKCLERECSYIADFVYLDIDGNEIVEDTKGFRTPEYIIKRKLMLQKYGIRIREI